jgi:hypothetical protein
LLIGVTSSHCSGATTGFETGLKLTHRPAAAAVVPLDGLQCSPMDDKFLQIFALAYLIGWLLARMPKRN